MAEVDIDEGLKKMIFDHLQCIICNDIFEIPFVTNCGHTFCKKCIEEWRKQSEKCPICRSDIVSISKNQVLVGQLDKLQEKSYLKEPSTMESKSPDLLKFILELIGAIVVGLTLVNFQKLLIPLLVILLIVSPTFRNFLIAFCCRIFRKIILLLLWSFIVIVYYSFGLVIEKIELKI